MGGSVVHTDDIYYTNEYDYNPNNYINQNDLIEPSVPNETSSKIIDIIKAQVEKALKEFKKDQSEFIKKIAKEVYKEYTSDEDSDSGADL